MNFIPFVLMLLLVISVAELAKKNCAMQNPGFTGGFVKVDTNSSKIQKLAKMTVEKYFVDSGSHCTFLVEKILSAETQIVAGERTVMKLEICIDTCKNDVDKDPNDLTGNFVIAKTDSENIKEVARKAVFRYFRGSSLEGIFKLERVLAAKRAIEGVGTTTVMNIEICPRTDCQDCDMKGIKCKVCNIEVWERVGSYYVELKKFDCSGK